MTQSSLNNSTNGDSSNNQSDQSEDDSDSDTDSESTEASDSGYEAYGTSKRQKKWKMSKKNEKYALKLFSAYLG